MGGGIIVFLGYYANESLAGEDWVGFLFFGHTGVGLEKVGAAAESVRVFLQEVSPIGQWFSPWFLASDLSALILTNSVQRGGGWGGGKEQGFRGSSRRAYSIPRLFLSLLFKFYSLDTRQDTKSTDSRGRRLGGGYRQR